MNEPRSQAELYITQRKTTDGSKIYNISYNPADDLQSWIEDMAAYIKGIDPIHLLSTGAFHSCTIYQQAHAAHCKIQCHNSAFGGSADEGSACRIASVWKLLQTKEIQG